MIGIVPYINKTYEVAGDLSCTPEIGKLYVDPSMNGRIFIYHPTIRRSCPDTGYFPVWDGEERYISRHSNEKYLDRDVIKTDINILLGSIDPKVLAKIKQVRKDSENDEVISMTICEKDNMFTQCIKEILNIKQVSITDLSESSGLTYEQIESYCNALKKTSLMRIDRWLVWTSIILKLNYKVIIYDGPKEVLVYSHPDNKYETGLVSYDSVIKKKDDFLKKITKIVMLMYNISKEDLMYKETDNYTINNLLITINGPKNFSSQLFSRFIRLTSLSYKVKVYEGDKQLIEFKGD